jgi:hypothetical protein
MQTGELAGRRRWLSIAVAAGVLARVSIVAGAGLRRGLDAFLVPDSFVYLRLADSFAAGEGFRGFRGVPELFRTPAYPLLLAVGKALGFPVVFALAVQVAMSAGIIVLTFLLARHVLRDERLAAGCAFVVAIEPTLMAWSLKVMPETFLTLALVAFAYAAVRALESPRLRWIATAAVALCLAAYVKPIAWPLVVLLCVASLMRIRTAAIFIPLCVLLLAPWHMRNTRYGYAGFSTLFARAAYLSAGGSIVAQREGRPYEEVRRELLQKADARGPKGDPAAAYGREGVSLIASNPLGYAEIHVKGMLRTMFDPGAAEYLRFFDLYREGGRARLAEGGLSAAMRAYPLMFWCSVALAIVLAPLVLLPLIGMFRARNAAFLLLFAISAYLITAGGGVPGYARFRVPAVPFLIVMSTVVMKRTLDSPHP